MCGRKSRFSSHKRSGPTEHFAAGAAARAAAQLVGANRNTEAAHFTSPRKVIAEIMWRCLGIGGCRRSLLVLLKIYVGGSALPQLVCTPEVSPKACARSGFDLCRAKR